MQFHIGIYYQPIKKVSLEIPINANTKRQFLIALYWFWWVFLFEFFILFICATRSLVYSVQLCCVEANTHLCLYKKGSLSDLEEYFFCLNNNVGQRLCPSFTFWSHCYSSALSLPISCIQDHPGRPLIQGAWFQHIFRMTPRLSRTGSLCCGVSWAVDNLAGATFSLALCSLCFSPHPVMTLADWWRWGCGRRTLFYDQLTTHCIYLYGF